jgi:WD40 repeat protein
MFQVWDLTTLQCIQTLSDHTDVVMSVLCWDQFLLSCSLDQTVKVSTHTSLHFINSGNVHIIHCAFHVYHASNICFVSGMGSYGQWKLRSDIYTHTGAGRSS